MLMKRFTLGLLALLSLTAATAAQEAASDEGLLQALDEARFLSASSFRMTVEVVATRAEGTQQARMQLYFKEIDGQAVSRIEFLAPEELAGQVFLSTPEGTFFWNPDLVTPLRTSGGQAAFGDASVAETAGIRFAGNYEVNGQEEFAFEDGTPGLRLELADPQRDVPGADKQAFPRVSVALERESRRPRSMRLFALSGDPVNDVSFLRYDELDGDLYLAEQLIESRVIEGNTTRLSILEIEAVELDDGLFDPERLGQDTSG